MVDVVADKLTAIVRETALRMRALDDASVSARRDADAWSIKEIVGHLVDSAANNHQRFVRAQHSPALDYPKYEQDAWVRSQDYQSWPWVELIDFWRLYNVHLAHVIRRVPKDKLNVECRIAGNAPVTLEYLIEDYLVHLQHHLKQIEEREADVNP